jgi:uncharacterized protein YutE (UPF0331/DUF86 family)
MVVKTRAILERLHALDDYIRLLQPYRQWDVRRLTEDRIVYGGVLHYLQLAAQVVMDVSAHLQVELDLGHVTDYREAILSLGKHGVLPEEFIERMSGLTGFRNILVHEYLTVDPMKVHQVLQHGVEDLKEFIVYITDFLQREGYIQE